MRTIYISSDFKCHAANDGTMTAVETDYFEGKCDAYIEGYCYENSKFYPWMSHAELAGAQAQYERDYAELQAAYQEGVNSAYD